MRTCFGVLAVALFAAFAPASECAAADAAVHEWPAYKGNSGFSGVSADSSVKPPLKLLWSYRLDSDASNDAGGGPIVAGGLVYVPVHNTRSVVAIDAHTGRFVWQYSGFQAAIRKVPTYSAGRLLLWNRQQRSSAVIALDARTGRELWQKPLEVTGSDPDRAGLPVLDGKVYCSEGGDEPFVVALSEATGETVWRTGLGKEDGLSVVCPSVAGGKVFVGTVNGHGWREGVQGAVFALDAKGGKILWRRQGVFPIRTLVSDGQVVACPMFGKEETRHFLLDAGTGETRWIGAKRFHYAPSTITDNLVLVKPYGGEFVAFDRASGKELWQFDGKSRSGCCTPVVSGNFAYMGTGVTAPGDVESLAAFQRVDAPREKAIAGTVFAVDLTTGKPVWKFSTGNTICGEPAIAYGKLYFAGRDGRLYCFVPAKDGEPTTPDARDQSPNVPAAEVAALLAPQHADNPRPGLDWPMQGGSPARTSQSDVTFKLPLELAWKLESGPRIVTSAAIRDGRAFVGSEAGAIVAADLATGKKLWEFPAGTPVRCSPAVANDLVYCGSDGGELYALDPATGKAKWTFHADGPVQASPAVVGGVLVFGANDHHVYALDRATGRKLWSFRLNDYCVHAPPVVHGDRVYVGQGTDWAIALDLKTGAELWRAFIPVTIEALAWHREKVYARTPNWIVELDPETGKRLRFSYASHGYGGMALSGGQLFQTGVQGQGGTNGATMLNLDTIGPELRPIPTLDGARTLERKTLKGTHDLAAMTTPLVLGGNKLCFSSLAGKVIVTEQDGTQLWKHDLGAMCHSSPVAADGTLLVGCDDGMLYAFREAPASREAPATK
jgi:outer membrane protein assembly factor BamB